MSGYYWLSVSGCRLSDEKLTHIPAPRFELFTHITMKNIQAGAVLGALVAPAVCLMRGQRECKQIRETAYKYGVTGMEIGAVSSPVMFAGFYMANKPEIDGIRDRCYRIRSNRNQMFVDRLSVVGLVAGLGVARYLGEELGKGAYFGFTSGTLLAGVVNILAAAMQ